MLRSAHQTLKLGSNLDAVQLRVVAHALDLTGGSVDAAVHLNMGTSRLNERTNGQTNTRGWAEPTSEG